MDNPADIKNENCSLVSQICCAGNPLQPFEKSTQRLDDDILLSEKIIYHETKSLLCNAYYYDKGAVRLYPFRIRMEKTVQPEERERTLPELHHLFALDSKNVFFLQHERFKHGCYRKSVIAIRRGDNQGLDYCQGYRQRYGHPAALAGGALYIHHPADSCDVVLDNIHPDTASRDFGDRLAGREPREEDEIGNFTICQNIGRRDKSFFDCLSPDLVEDYPPAVILDLDNYVISLLV